jgi:hypothetical protein
MLNFGLSPTMYFNLCHNKFMDVAKRMDDSSIRKLYSSLVKINEESFDGAQYDVAYHALCAALHCAASLKEINYLSEVERLAVQQLDWIDAHDPEYEHSSQSASKRGHVSIYKNLAKMANARALIIHQQASNSPSYK